MATKHHWRNLEKWSPRLFILAGVFLVVAAVHSGLAFLGDAHAFNQWHGIVLELGRLTALLGVAGLTGRVVDQNPRLGNVSRAIASLAIVFVIVLIALATLAAAGVLTGPPGLIGLATYVLSVSTFFVTGTAIIRTGAHSRRIGGLLLADVVGLLVVFFGRLVVPLGLVATLVPAIQVLIYFSVGHSLQVQGATTQRTAPATDTTP